MLAEAPLIAFVATRDAARAIAFYRGVLGLALVADDPFAVAFDAHGTMLRIQKVEKLAPHPFTTLGWHVEHIDELASALAARGVRFERFPGMEQDAHGIWTAPGGARVAWFKDPDGNTLSLTQFGDERMGGGAESP
jgi:catechol 2,3-dioxygenase-like lactoylglutathione lyase family enzyme